MAGNVSIHLMLLFIKKFIFITGGKDKFQYISCYSLSGRSVRTNCSLNVSIHLMLLFIGQYTSPGYTKLYRFNTSHVTLYPYDDTYDVVIHWFQYISCYSLSQEDESYDETGIVSIHLMLLFIITPVAEDWDKRLFQYISCYSLSVYVLPLQSAPSFQYISCYSLSSMCITMHNIFLFQYISCYSLSLVL